ncbi:cytochrome C assembly family protein [Thalassotalea fusca]
MDFSSISALVAFVSYTIATTLIVARLFHPDGPNLVKVLGFGCLAIVLHSLSTSNFLYDSGTINFALSNVVSLVSLVITLSVTVIALKYKVNLLLPVVYGFAGFWQLIMALIPHNKLTPLVTDNLALFSHVTLALIAYCVLIIAMLFAFQVAYINMKLKEKALSAVSHLPPLMQVEAQLFTILAAGTILLLISQLTGVFFLDEFFSKSNAHKAFFSLLALVIYVAILWGHYHKGWRGHRVLFMTTIATGLLTLAYFGSRFVKEFLIL